jgi:hypothetical protein
MAELRAAAARHADADRDPDALAAGDGERLLHHEASKLLGQPHRLLGERLGEDEHELLAAVPPEGIAGTDRTADEIGDLPQDRVAGVVSVGVVDRLEAIDVDERDAERLGVPHGAIDLRRQRAQQALAVPDPGEAVARGASLRLQERPAGGIEGTRQAALGGNARDTQLDRRVGVDRLFQRLRDRAEPPPHVAPGDERHGRHSGDGRHGEHQHQGRTLRGFHVGGHREPDRHQRSNGQRSQESEGADETEHG